MQERALRPIIKAAGIQVATSKVAELRRVGDNFDKSKRKGDLTATNLYHRQLEIPFYITTTMNKKSEL